MSQPLARFIYPFVCILIWIYCIVGVLVLCCLSPLIGLYAWISWIFDIDDERVGRFVIIFDAPFEWKESVRLVGNIGLTPREQLRRYRDCD